MQYQQEDKQEGFSCPITNNVIRECNVTTCMWYCSNYKGSCSLVDKTISEYDLGDIKGFTISSVNKSIRKGKADIIKVITLDKYLSWVLDNKLDLKIKNKTYLKRTFESSICKNKLFNISYREFGQACMLETYTSFKEKNPSLKQTKLSFLLGVRENKLKIIQKSIKVKK